MDRSDIVAFLLVGAGAVVALSLYRLHRDKESSFDLSNLVTHNGRVDNAKFCQIGAFFLSSWVVYYLTLKGNLTEWAFGLYMASWVGARIASLIASIKGGQKMEETK